MTNIIIPYSVNELKQLTNSELFQVILRVKDNHSLHWLSIVVKRTCPNLYAEIRCRTQFLDKFYQNKYDSLPARLYCLEHDIMEQPICQNPNCPGHNPVGWYPTTNSFRKYCCVKCSSQCEATQELSKQTMKRRYGVEHPSQSTVIQDKMRRTWLKNLGVTHPMRSQAVKQKFSDTMMRNHGVEHALQSQVFIDKVKETNTRNFGCDWYTQTSEYHKTAHKMYVNQKYPDMTFATSWEFKVYDFLTENHIEFEYQPAISLPYECEGTHHTYHPDFLINDKIYEVKGDNFFRINENTGKEEMFLPWKGDLSDEEYEWRCKITEAKHQCMLRNDVIILRHQQIYDLKIELFQ